MPNVLATYNEEMKCGKHCKTGTLYSNALIILMLL
jgi:hypothetical protein